MNINVPVTEINFDYDDSLLLNEFLSFGKFDSYMIGGYEFNSHDLSLSRELYAEKFLKTIDYTGEYCVNYMFYQKGSNVIEHTDDPWIGSVALNRILNDNKDPIQFGNDQYFYKNAIIDITKPHRLNNLSSDRIVCRISFRNIDYVSLVNKLNS